MDLKVDSATNDTMRILKQNILSSASKFSLRIPNIQASERADICKAVVRSFGIPSVTPTTIQQIVNSLVWGNSVQGFSVYFTEMNPILFPGSGLSIIFGEMVFILGVRSILLFLPALVCLILTLACDLTLILLRAFQKCTHQCLSHPLMKDIKEAAYAYRGLSKEVHKSIKDLVSMSNVFENFRIDKIKIGYSGILQKYVKDFVES